MSRSFKYGDQTFATKNELHRFLVEHKDFELSRKKSTVKHSMPVSFHEPINKASAMKGVLFENDTDRGVLKRTILTNTYWWMDSHSDVHIGKMDGKDSALFSKSIRERASKIYPMDQHRYSLDGRIGKTIRLYEAPVTWKELGVSLEGSTEGLFAEAEIHRAKNVNRYNDYLNNEIDQHSVGMIYLNVQLAVNNKEEFPDEYEVYKKYIPYIANKEAVEEQGYFFAVLEAKLIEYSCVIEGSNELTPVMMPSSDTSERPSNDTLKALSELSQSIELINKCETIMKLLKQ